MIAVKEQICPRCEALIRPGDVTIPTPRGWSHAECAERDRSE